MSGHARLAVFASGGGTNLQALLDYFNRSSAGVARVELVVASRPGIGALARSEAVGVASWVLAPTRGPEEAAKGLLDVLEHHRIDVIALAGYIKLIPARVVDRFRGRIMNIHPALLPAFGGPGMYGMRVHQAVLAAGTRVSGATVHLVDERYDRGSILAQWPVPVFAADTPESLAARVLRVEHVLYPMAVEELVGASGNPSVPSELAFDLLHGEVPPYESVHRLVR
ncbi:MAG: phosphoribosylglycinamide formyltransferase [Gemmatimonas sp.]|nr:phosphoribosylglycinamide formyltransferase [Gemmatimonas sp.]